MTVFATGNDMKKKMFGIVGAFVPDWDKTIYSRLDGAATSDELAARADETRKAISRAVWSIKRRKNRQ